MTARAGSIFGIPKFLAQISALALGSVIGLLAVIENGDTIAAAAGSIVGGALGLTELPDTLVAAGNNGAATGTVIAQYSPSLTLSNGNLTATCTVGGSYISCFSQSTRGTTKVYAEVKISTAIGLAGLGVVGDSLNFPLGDTPTSYGQYASVMYNAGLSVGGVPNAIASGDWLAFALDRTVSSFKVRNITQGGSWSSAFPASVYSTADACLGASVTNVGEFATFNFDGALLGAPPDASYTRWDGSPVSAGTVLTYYSPADITLSNGNLTATRGSSGGYSIVLSQTTRGAIKVYAEVHVDTETGVITAGVGLNSELLNVYLGSSSTSYGWYGFAIYNNGVNARVTPNNFLQGDWLAFALDRSTSTFMVRNVSLGGAWSPPLTTGSNFVSTDACLGAALTASGDAVTFNFDGAFLGTPPDASYTRWDGSAISGAITGTLNRTEVNDTLSSACAITKTFFNPLMTSSSITLSNTNLTATRASASVYLLDAVTPQPTAAYSTRKLKSAYSGYAMKVSNNSADVFQDIGFVGDDLDLSAIATFAAANGNNVQVYTWYDQSGNGNDIGSASGSSEVFIYLSGLGGQQVLNANPALNFKAASSGSLHRGSAISTIISASEFTVISGIKPVSFPVYSGGIEYTPGLLGDGNTYATINGFWNNGSNNTFTTYLYDGADRSVNINATSQSYTAVSKCGSGILNGCLSGGPFITASAGNIQVTTGLIVVGSTGTSSYIDALVTELLIYNVALSSADINTICGSSSIVKGNVSNRCGATWSNVP